jgi:ClpP class serine protease
MEHAAEVLRTADEALCTAYTTKSGMTKEQALEMMEHETWLTAEKAKELGLIDGIMFEEPAQVSMVALDGGFRLPTKEQMDAMRREKDKENSKNKQIQAQLELLKLNRR